MVAPSNIVNGSIVANVNSLQQAGFGIPLVLGNSATVIAKGSFQIFTNMIGVSAIFNDSTPEWIEANSIFSQNPTVQQIFIGRELDRVAQISTIVFSADLNVGVRQEQTIVFSDDLITGNHFHITVNGGTPIDVPFNTDNATTLDDIVSALTDESGISGDTSSDGVHTITVISADVGASVTLTAYSVSGGASQANVVVTQTVAPIAADVVSGYVNDELISVTATTSNAATLTALASDISDVGGDPTTGVSNGSHVITVTSNNVGIAFTLTSWAVTGPSAPTVVVTTTTPNVGLSTSLNSIANVNNGFYGVIWCERTAVYVENAFDVIEATPYFYMTVSEDANILDPSSTTDIAFLCMNGNYGRSAVWYSAQANTHPLDGAVFGKNLPNPPGKVNWAFTQLNGVAADNLTQNQYAAALAKNCNVFVPFANLNLTYKGTCGSGLYIDFRIGIDWMNSAMVTALFNTIAQIITGNKVPYTDDGVQLLVTAMYGPLEQGAQNQFVVGGLKSAQNPQGYSVGFIPVAQIPLENVAARYYPDLTFEATFVSAVDSCTYRGTISLP